MRKTGLSLMQVLIVVMLLAIVAFFLRPWSVRNREMGRRSACHDNLRAVHYCFTMYEQEFGMFPARPGKDQFSGDAQEAINLLYRQYTDDVRIFSCPSKPLSAAMLNGIL